MPHVSDVFSPPDSFPQSVFYGAQNKEIQSRDEYKVLRNDTHSSKDNLSGSVVQSKCLSFMFVKTSNYADYARAMYFVSA